MYISDPLKRKLKQTKITSHLSSNLQFRWSPSMLWSETDRDIDIWCSVCPWLTDWVTIDIFNIIAVVSVLVDVNTLWSLHYCRKRVWGTGLGTGLCHQYYLRHYRAAPHVHLSLEDRRTPCQLGNLLLLYSGQKVTLECFFSSSATAFFLVASNTTGITIRI